MLSRTNSIFPLPVPQEDLEERREQLVQDHTSFLLGVSGSCYPYTEHNFFEALENLPPPSREKVFKEFKVFLLSRQPKAANAVLDALDYEVVAYWNATARAIAEQTIDFNP